jgi:multiple sugar transport system permease protein
MHSKSHLGIYQFKQKIIPWLFLFPGITFTLILRYYTIFEALKLSFFKYELQNPPGTFIGLKNFGYLLNNSAYKTAWKNSIIFLGLILVLNFCVPLIQALLLSEIKGKLRNFFSTAYILPALVPITINVLLWRWIFDPTYGMANRVISFFGGQPQLWLSDLDMVKTCIIIPGIIGGGISVLLYLAAILGVSEDILEAAQLDGCSGIKKMFYITFPNIMYLIKIQLILTTMGAFQLLDLPFQFTSGGPGDASTTVPIFIYRLFNNNFDYGQASAAAIPLMVVIAIITSIQLKLNKQERE